MEILSLSLPTHVYRRRERLTGCGGLGQERHEQGWSVSRYQYYTSAIPVLGWPGLSWFVCAVQDSCLLARFALLGCLFGCGADSDSGRRDDLWVWPQPEPASTSTSPGARSDSVDFFRPPTATRPTNPSNDQVSGGWGCEERTESGWSERSVVDWGSNRAQTKKLVSASGTGTEEG